MDTSPLNEALDQAARRRRLPERELRGLIRHRAGVSRQAVADEVGVTYEAVRLWEVVGRDPTGDNLRAYLAVLDRLASEGSNGDL